MLFNSYAFIFLFLPLLLLSGKLAGLYGAYGLSIVLLIFSFVFYGLWGLPFLCLLAAVICVNYAIGLALAKSSAGPRKGLLAIALALNLAPLVWFKYSGFLAQNLAAFLPIGQNFTAPGLPLGISFYTFIQIAWLVGVYRRQIQPEGLARHALFSSFFPYVISGPIVRYEQMGPQFDVMSGGTSEGLARGFALFSMGLAKKVVIADSIAVYANAVFSAAEKAWPVTGAEAWLGSLCYTFQLYFDFSGYTDMAIGIGLMLGLHLPENFLSPYKSTGIVDFWRRWHVTLGVWLRDFLYIPLGGNRRGRLIQYRNLFLTMLIGGAWHGAGWTFIAWGALHGAMLCVNHFFRARIKGSPLEETLSRLPFRLFFIALTFFCLNFCWVVFRSVSIEGAGRMYRAMFAGPLAADGAGGTLSGLLCHHYFQDWQAFFLLALSAAIVWCLPNSHEIFFGRKDGGAVRPAFRPTGWWAAGLALLAFASLTLLSRQSVFLYFQF